MSTAPHLYKKGQSGNPAGRPKGAKTKIKIDVSELMHAIDFNPFLKLVDLAKNSRSEKVQCEAASELAAYCAPKLKAVEWTNDSESPLEIFINIGDKKHNVNPI